MKNNYCGIVYKFFWVHSIILKYSLLLRYPNSPHCKILVQPLLLDTINYLLASASLEHDNNLQLEQDHGY